MIRAAPFPGTASLLFNIMPEHLSKEDIAFEIAFYNGLIEKNPQFAEAFITLGELYAQAGMFPEALIVDEKLVQLRPSDPVALYNLACSYSLLGEIDKALRSVKKAVKCGYSDFKHMGRDADLANLREDRRFQHYYARVKGKKNSESSE
jgi:tetratricopeptide (TPR) repeat protein